MAINKNETFSPTAIKEINDLKKLVDTVMDKSMEMFGSRQYNQKMVDLISNTEQEIDDKTDLYKSNHIERLSKGSCNATVSTLFMELLTNLERIADHSTNIAFSLYPNQRAPHNESEAINPY